MYGICFQIQRYSIHDGPGIRTTLFLKGCPLRCLWCHNPESQRKSPVRMLDADKCLKCGACAANCPTGALLCEDDGTVSHDPSFCGGCGKCAAACPTGALDISGKWYTAEALAEIALRDEVFFDESGGGVTVSGGEPLAQAEFLSELLGYIKARGVRTAVDTCGYAQRADLERVLPLTDLFLYDLKCADSERHRALTGVGNERILENLRFLSESGANIWGRMPIIPGLNDEPETVLDGLRVFARAGVERVHLIPYHGAGQYKYDRLGEKYTLGETRAPEADKMEAYRRMAGSLSLKIMIGG